MKREFSLVTEVAWTFLQTVLKPVYVITGLLGVIAGYCSNSMKP